MALCMASKPDRAISLHLVFLISRSHYLVQSKSLDLNPNLVLQLLLIQYILMIE